MHAYDWRSPRGAAPPATASPCWRSRRPSARLGAALAEAREAVANDEIVVVGLKSGEAAAAERVA